MDNSALIRNTLDEVYGDDDFRLLCFDLNVDYDSLPGETKRLRIAELIQYFNRRDKLADLVSYCIKERPHIKWEELFELKLWDANQARSQLSNLSTAQKQLLIQIVLSEAGIYAFQLVDKVNLSRGEVVYRARDMEALGLIKINNLTDYEYSICSKLSSALPQDEIIDLLSA